MHPELFKIPFVNFTLHSYGLLLVIGLLLAMQLAKFLARRSGIDGEMFVTAGILALVSGLIGARIVYVLQNFHEFTGGTLAENFFSAINLTSGGLVYYGGFLLATPTLIAWGLWNKIPILRGMDIIAPCLMIGLALGRVGAFSTAAAGAR
jgi:phosphatidylglycerol:prolipoprotein diacylglycerol transferase